MRILLCGMLLASMIVVTGCAVMPMSPVMAPLVLEQRGPVAGFDGTAASTKTATARAEGILIVGFGDASIQKAMEKGEMTKVHHVDSEVLNVFNIYCRYDTVVYGE